MPIPDSSSYTRFLRDKSMVSGVPINPIKNSVSTIFFKQPTALNLLNFLPSTRKRQ